jgi:hypothetical protein
MEEMWCIYGCYLSTHSISIVSLMAFGHAVAGASRTSRLDFRFGSAIERLKPNGVAYMSFKHGDAGEGG